LSTALRVSTYQVPAPPTTSRAISTAKIVKVRFAFYDFS